MTKAQAERWANVPRGPNAQIIHTDSEGRALDLEVGRKLRTLEQAKKDVERRYKLACDHVLGTAKVLQAAQEQAAHAERERADLADQIALFEELADLVRDSK